jgi:hypothetical protein
MRDVQGVHAEGGDHDSVVSREVTGVVRYTLTTQEHDQGESQLSRRSPRDAGVVQADERLARVGRRAS